MNNLNKFAGVDCDLMVSLDQYGVVCCTHYTDKTQTEKTNTFIYYDPSTLSYHTISLSTDEIDANMLDMESSRRESLLGALGISLSDWMESSPCQKVCDLLFEVSLEDIFGVNYCVGIESIDDVIKEIGVLEDVFANSNK